MSYYGTYSPTLGWSVFGPLSVFLFQPTMFWRGGSFVVSGPKGPYEWWYLSASPDLADVFAVGESIGMPTPPPRYQYVGSFIRFGFKVLGATTTDSPHLVVYSLFSSHLAVLQLPFALSVRPGVTIYIVFYFQNTPLN